MNPKLISSMLCCATLLPGAGGGEAARPALAPVDAATTNLLTLDHAIRLALEHHPDLQVSEAQVAAAAGDARQARQWPNPELEWSVEEWPVGSGGEFSDAKQTVGVGQTLPFPGKKALDRQVGNAEVRINEAKRDGRRRELTRDVKVGFYRVLAAENLLALAAELVALAERSAAAARQRVDAGATAYQEQLRAEVQWEQARAGLTDFQRERQRARQALATLLGRPDLVDVPLGGALADSGGAALARLVPDLAAGEHPRLTEAQALLDQAQLEHRRSRLDPYPDVRVAVAGGRAGASDESIVEFRLAVPLPLLDRSRGRQEAARARATAAAAAAQAVRNELQRDQADALARCAAAREQVAQYRERVLPKAQEALRLVERGFEQGKFSFMDLLDTQRTTAEVRLAYQQRLLELNVAQAELEALVPSLPAPALRPDVPPSK